MYNYDSYQQMEQLDEFLFRLTSAVHQTKQQHKTGLLFVESFRTCGTSKGYCNRMCQRSRQGQMAYNIAGG